MKAYFLAVPNDDILKGFRERVGVAAGATRHVRNTVRELGGVQALALPDHPIRGGAKYGDWIERLLYNGIGAALPMGERGRISYYADYRTAAAKRSTTTYFSSIPDEVVDAARVDGSSPISTLLYICIPLSIPMLGIAFIFSFIFFWNESRVCGVIQAGCGAPKPRAVAEGDVRSASRRLPILNRSPNGLGRFSTASTMSGPSEPPNLKPWPLPPPAT